MQVVDVCRRANPRLVIKRAKFSALVRRELERSVQTLGLPDENASKAVDARQEIDLRIGASFTRFQTLLLQVHHHAHLSTHACGGATVHHQMLLHCGTHGLHANMTLSRPPGATISWQCVLHLLG